MSEVAVQDIELTIPGFTIAARVWGPPDGKPVLCAHGWLDNAASFDRLAPLLEGFRLVVIDLPGHGRSAHLPAGATYHFIDILPRLVDVADMLGWQKFSLLCHSMGAGAASLLAGTIPKRIDRVVLLDGLGPTSAPGARAAEQLEKALTERGTLAAKSPRTFQTPEEAVELIAQIYQISPENAAVLMSRGLTQSRHGDGRTTWHFTYDLRLRAATSLYMTESQVLSFFARISAPTLLIRPDDGWPFDPNMMHTRIEAIPHLELLRVPGNHHVHLEHPERIAPAVQSFLEAADM